MTVTAVETSPDLRNARAFVSVLGDADQREETLDGLRASHGFLQAKVGEELRMKRTPKLEFAYDESVDEGMRISELLDHEARPEQDS